MLTGPGPEQATYGPYFGRIEAEMMVVSAKGFFITRDGGKVCTNVAPFFVVPDGYGKKFSGTFFYFGWDPVGDVVYASALGGSVYRLKLTQ